MLPSDILSLDLGVRTGVAWGGAGRAPESYVIILKREGEDASVAFSNLLAHLVSRFDAGPPRMVVKEALLFGPHVNAGVGGATFRIHFGMHAIVEAVCGRWKVPFHDAVEATWRKHFTGRGRWGSRGAGKAATVQRCHLLGLLPEDVADDNRADAVGIHDYAGSTLARAPPRELHLFSPPVLPADPPSPRQKRRGGS